MMTTYVYTKDHPEANRRRPIPGERAYLFTFPLQDGNDIVVCCGAETLLRFSDMIGRMLIDDAEADGESIKEF